MGQSQWPGYQQAASGQFPQGQTPAWAMPPYPTQPHWAPPRYAPAHAAGGVAHGAMYGAQQGFQAPPSAPGTAAGVAAALGADGPLTDLIGRLNLDDRELWKGALIGAAAVLLLTNESVQQALFKTGVRARDAVADGVAQVKARVRPGTERDDV